MRTDPTIPAVVAPAYDLRPSPLLEAARRLEARIVGWRRELHRRPELSFQEHRTTEFLRERLVELGWRVEPLVHPTGVLAVLDVPGATRTVALRADIDALPIEELSGLPFKSEVAGVSHMCGHDAHSSIALGAAAILSAQRGRLTRRVKIVFQPAEEVPPGGAAGIVESGAIDDVEEIAALHVEPAYPTGTVALRAGPLTAASDRFTATVRGRGGHGASPDLCIDPVVTAAHAITALQTLVSRGVDPVDSAVVTVAQVRAGTSFNIIPAEAVFSGTVRSFNEPVRDTLHRRLRVVIEGVCAAHGATAGVDIRRGYPPVVNDAGVIDRIRRAARAVIPDPAKILEARPLCGGEDFAYYCRRVPGAMFLLGIGNPGFGSTHACHSPHFRVDESALPIAAAILAGFCLGEPA
jgi:amidohydrolase